MFFASACASGSSAALACEGRQSHESEPVSRPSPSIASIAIGQKRTHHTLQVEHLHQLSKTTFAPSSPVFTPVSPVAIAVKFSQDCDDNSSNNSRPSRNSSSSDSDSDSVMNLPSTPLRPTLIYLGDDGKIQYTLGDAPASRLCDLKWYADQLAERDQMVADMGAEKIPTDDTILGLEKMHIVEHSAPVSSVSPSPYPPPCASATRVPPQCDASHADAEVHLVDYGVAEIRLSTSFSNPARPRQPWHVPVTVYIEADGVTIDMHTDTPEKDRARIIVSALRHAYNLLAPVMQLVERSIRAAMPGYVGLGALKLSPPAVAPNMVRSHHLSTPVSSPMPPVGVPRLILVNTLANMYLLMYPAAASATSPDWVRFGGTLDLTPETLVHGAVYQHPHVPPIVKVSHDLFLRALRRVVGVAAAPPNAVVRAMMRADAVGECQRHEEDESDEYGLDDGDSDGESDDDHLDFEIDPEMFGG